MPKHYTKTHKLKKAANRHALQIRNGGGVVTGKTVKGGFKIEYYYPANALDVHAKNLSELITQSALLNTKTVEVTFVPYGKNKKGKKSYFDVIDEGSTILHLMNNKDVVSVKFKK